MAVFLHIGTHKTGTTSIQYYLNYRKEELLAQGILAPDAGKPANSKFNGNHRLAWAVDGRKGEASKESWNDLAEEMEKESHKKVVISAEAFCKLSNDHVGQVKELLQGHEVFIVVYFRNYKDYFRSVYAQVVRDHKEARSFSRYISERHDHVDFDRILRTWGNHFGFDHLVVRVYDEVVAKGNLLKDFCNIIGFIPPENDTYFQLQQNVTPDEKAINALRLINLCKANLPFLMNDHTFKNLKNALYWKKKEYARHQRFFSFLAGKHYFTRRSERLITDLANHSNNELLKKLIGEESMKYLVR